MEGMNATKKLMFEVARIVNAVNGTNNSASCAHEQESCQTTTLITCLSLICVLGVASNVVLLYSDYKEWKRRKTPDKVLICNITITNLAALLISLPFQIVYLWHKSEGCGIKGLPKGVFKLGDLQKFSLAVCTLATSTTLGILGIDRLDALTKFAHQRKLTVTKAIIASILVWLSSFLSVLFLMLSEVRIMPMIISIWICISCIAIVTSLLLATRRIRKHRQEIIQMFGARQARAEIKFTKTVVALSVCFVVFMLPHLVASFKLVGIGSEDRSKCTIFLLLSMTYLSFMLLPVVYFSMDRKMLSTVLLKRVAPSTSGLKTTKRDTRKEARPATVTGATLVAPSTSDSKTTESDTGKEARPAAVTGAKPFAPSTSDSKTTESDTRKEARPAAVTGAKPFAPSTSDSKTTERDTRKEARPAAVTGAKPFAPSTSDSKTTESDTPKEARPAAVTEVKPFAPSTSDSKTTESDTRKDQPTPIASLGTDMLR